ncbi:Serine phosphatase RsbU, regulator of sigma subunit [Flexibacter flexilis DSM 6793]|uniref:Serine phosphatase RsbU, regulator of sigma subunit n=1 Tax=Flexibacter flexilis DSM 6793 TaxID=927664 RepID=A0A1I1DS64_9BACT|nr:tetratricopeptide repeat protein [Flexibacter flexilis]SFB77236.1 Serine phosphatase RsbU, regulator of sigma subunit [Flexibacter flexilis DSM 6793]
MKVCYTRVIVFWIMVIFCCYYGAHAQYVAAVESARADSPTPVPVNSQIEALLQQAKSSLDEDHEQAVKLSERALKLARASQNNHLIAKASYSCGMAYINQNLYVKSENYLVQALEYYARTSPPDSAAIAYTLRELGNLEKGRSNYTQSLNYYFSALKTFQQLGDSSEVGYTFNSIGAVYISLQKYEKSIEYLKKSEAMRLQIHDRRGLASTYNNLGISYSDVGKNDTALHFYLETLKYCQEIKFEKGITLSYNNIGHLYYTEKDYKKAHEYYDLALYEARRLNLRSGLSAVLVNLADICRDEKKYSQAIKYGNEALLISHEIADKKRISEAYESLAKIYQNTGQYSQAFDFQRKYSLLRDTLYNEAEARETSNMEAQYQSQQQRKEIELLMQEQKITDLELHKQKNILYVYTLAGTLLVVVVFMLYRSDRNRKQRNQELAKQNDEIRSKSIEIMLQSDIIRTAHNKITDSIRYAQRIQESILPMQENIMDVFPDSFIFFRPLDMVSGDFFWFSKVGNEYIWVAADCTGHGVPGALMTMMANTLLNQIVNGNKCTEPAQIICDLEKGIRENLHRHGAADDQQNPDGMDLAVCRIDFQTQTLTFSGANRPLYHIRNQGFTEIKGSKFSVGGMKALTDKIFENHVMQWQNGDCFYIGSDGYADQFGGKSERKFMAKNLKQLLLQIHAMPMPDQGKKLEEAFFAWKGSFTQTDDIMIIGFRM